MDVELHKLCKLKGDMSYLKPKTSGIYALLYNNQVIYVGQSRDIRTRLLHHANTKSCLKQLEKRKSTAKSFGLEKKRYEFIEEHFNEIDFLYIPVELAELNQYEEYYIKKYKPIYNYSGVIGKYHPVDWKVG